MTVIVDRLRSQLLQKSHALLRRLAKADRALRLERIGSEYGGWIVPTGLVESDWICYSGGVGEDVSFDLGVIERFDCRVYAFDPTPRAIKYVQSIASPGFVFLPLALWSGDGGVRLWAPSDPSHVSYSAMNLQNTDRYIEVGSVSMASAMELLGHDHVDLVKLDIEGAEHVVTRQMLAAGVRPTVLCLEIDQPVRVDTLWSTMLRLWRAGYVLQAIDGWNLTLVRARTATEVG